jgi:uncharacterized protein
VEDRYGARTRALARPAQLAVGLTHAARGNGAGATGLLRRGIDNIGPYRDDAPHDIDIPGLMRWATSLIDELDSHQHAGAVDTSAPQLRGNV